MNNELEFFEILPKVDVYKNLLPDSSKLYDIMKRSSENSNGQFYLREWEPWSFFGTYSQEKHGENEPREFGQMYDEEKYLSDTVYEAYNLAISDYIKRHKIELPESAKLMSSSFSKYDPNIDAMKNNMTMQYHTDYILTEKDMPGPKFFLTCTTYINDDYDGGEIEFFIDNEYYPYKPKAGDILVFPSTEPYFHGVKTIKNGNKFFIRNFIYYYYEGSKDWLANQQLFGAVNWMKMEQKRLEEENPKAMRYSDRKK